MNTTAPDNRRFPSGIAGLDTILGGGVMLGGLYIVQGGPGTGKTTLTNQICFHHVAGGGQALFVTLLAENHTRMIGNLRQMSFFDEARIGKEFSYLSGLDEIAQGGLPGLSKLLRREIQRRRVSLLVIDGLVTTAASVADEETFKTFVHDLQEIALATDCTMLLTANATRDNSHEQTMVDGLILLNDRIYGWRAESDLQVTKFRGGGFLRGRHSYKITTAGIVVYPRIEALFANPSRVGGTSAGRARTGIARLDAMLEGGIPVASTTMVMGPSGIGKTTLGLHFLSQSSADEPGLMFGFYETPTSLRDKADRIVPSLGPLFDSGAVELLWQTPTSDLIDAYGQAIIEAVQRRKAKRLFIDGLTAFRNGAVDPSRVGNFFSALSNELRVRGVSTIYSLEVPNILGPAVNVPVDDASRLAENMILMRFVERGGRLHRLVSILKARDSGFDSSLREYDLTAKGIEIHDTPTSLEQVPSAAEHAVQSGPASRRGS
jgi:circadian clock protein KaiC